MLDSSPARSGAVDLPVAVRSRWRWRTLAAVIGAYVGLTIAVVVGSALDSVDRRAAAMDLARHWPDLEPWVLRYEVVAQRAPSAAVAGAYLLWRAWRSRSSRPIVMLVTALVLLNVSVGAVKLAIGRLGPLLTTHPRAVFDGGDIFPSGHTSNAVVVFGVLAVLAFEHRRLAIALAAFGAITIGLGTIFLDTHWVTDVFGGWLAGVIVLLVLPEATTSAQLLISAVAQRCARRAPVEGELPPRGGSVDRETRDAIPSAHRSRGLRPGIGRGASGAPSWRQSDSPVRRADRGDQIAGRLSR